MYRGIKAIETRYKGYRFRSRLEARWAVFFDALGIKWEYEKEGLDLNGVWYLPDFYLPHIDTWVEIKPAQAEDPWPDHRMFNYIEGIVRGQGIDAPIPNFVLVAGDPWIERENIYDYTAVYNGRSYQLFNAPAEDYAYCGYVFADNSYRWCECPECGKIGIEYAGRSGRLCQCFRSDKAYNTASPRLLEAYGAARAARFGT